MYRMRARASTLGNVNSEVLPLRIKSLQCISVDVLPESIFQSILQPIIACSAHSPQLEDAQSLLSRVHCSLFSPNHPPPPMVAPAERRHGHVHRESVLQRTHHALPEFFLHVLHLIDGQSAVTRSAKQKPNLACSTVLGTSNCTLHVGCSPYPGVQLCFLKAMRGCARFARLV